YSRCMGFSRRYDARSLLPAGTLCYLPDLEGQSVSPILTEVPNGFSHALHQEDPQPADWTLVQRRVQVRSLTLQGIELPARITHVHPQAVRPGHRVSNDRLTAARRIGVAEDVHQRLFENQVQHG